jgi:hypothetical protein
VSPRSFAQAVKCIDCQLFILKFHTIYIYSTVHSRKQVELHPLYQNLIATPDLISWPCTLSFTLDIMLLKLHTCILTLALALVYSLSLAHSCPHIILLVFCSLLSHIVYLVKFNYYLIPLIIGRFIHPLTPLSSTSRSVIILIFFIVIDTASISTSSQRFLHHFCCWSCQ